MKISKEHKGNRISVYQPDEKEKKMLFKISDKIIDLIIEYNLTDDQYIHLISSLYVAMRDEYNIIGMEQKGEPQ